MNPDARPASLDSLDGWKRSDKKAPLFFGGRKKSFARREHATDEAVRSPHRLAACEREDAESDPDGFAPARAIASDRLAEREAAATGVEPGTVRYGDTSDTCFEPRRGEEGSKAEGDTVSTSLGAPDAGRFVHPIADGGPFPLVVDDNVAGKPGRFPVDAHPPGCPLRHAGVTRSQ